jgi:hypothetical protein
MKLLFSFMTLLLSALPAMASNGNPVEPILSPVEPISLNELKNPQNVRRCKNEAKQLELALADAEVKARTARLLGQLQKMKTQSENLLYVFEHLPNAEQDKEGNEDMEAHGFVLKLKTIQQLELSEKIEFNFYLESPKKIFMQAYSIQERDRILENLRERKITASVKDNYEISYFLPSKEYNCSTNLILGELFVLKANNFSTNALKHEILERMASLEKTLSEDISQAKAMAQKKSQDSARNIAKIQKRLQSWNSTFPEEKNNTVIDTN